MKTDIQPLGYRPQTPTPLDLEVFSVADLRHRAKEQLRTTHRYEFHTVVCVTQGTCTQMVDFKSIACAPGSLLVVRAGQAHNYGPHEDWDGWNLLFRPEFALPVSTTTHDRKLALDFERLPEHMALGDPDLRMAMALFEQMREDTLMDAPQDDVHSLLRHQLHTLLTLHDTPRDPHATDQHGAAIVFGQAQQGGMEAVVRKRRLDLSHHGAWQALAQQAHGGIDPIGLAACLHHLGVGATVGEYLVVPVDGSAQGIGVQTPAEGLVVGQRHRLRGLQVG